MMHKKKKLLDNTLSYLYNALRHAGASIVAVEFTHRGKRWRVDTADEAIELRQKLEIEAAKQKQPLTPQQQVEEAEWEALRNSVWTADVFDTFIHSIGEQQRAAVKEMLKCPAILSTILAEKLGVEDSSLAGIFSGLSKQMKALGLHPKQLYTTGISWEGGGRDRHIYLNRGFQIAAEDAFWPRK
jgi:hypothetical protein